MKLSKQKNNIPILLALLLVVSVLFLSMKPNEPPSSNKKLDYKALGLVGETHPLFDMDIACTEDIVARVCGGWQLYSTQDCNCTKPAWNSWFDKTKYRRWCRTGSVGWGGWEYSPWVCNDWCRYK